MSKITIQRVGNFVKLWVPSDLPYDEKDKNNGLISAFSYECKDIQHAELFKLHIKKIYRFEEKE